MTLRTATGSSRGGIWHASPCCVFTVRNLLLHIRHFSTHVCPQGVIVTSEHIRMGLLVWTSLESQVEMRSSLSSLGQLQTWIRVTNITQKDLQPFIQSHHPPGQSVHQCPSGHRDAAQAQGSSHCHFLWDSSSLLPSLTFMLCHL